MADLKHFDDMIMEYDEICNKRNQLEIVCREEDGKSNYVDVDGNVISKIWFENVTYFGDDQEFAVVEITENNWNFIKRDGTILFPDMIFSYAFNFIGDYARVRMNKVWHIIRKDGFYDPNLRSISVPEVRGQLYLIKKDEQEYTFMSLEGKKFNLSFKKVYPEVSGFSRVQINRGNWNFVGSDGKLLSRHNFRFAEDFRMSLARVILTGNIPKLLALDGTLIDVYDYD